MRTDYQTYMIYGGPHKYPVKFFQELQNKRERDKHRLEHQQRRIETLKESLEFKR